MSISLRAVSGTWSEGGSLVQCGTPAGTVAGDLILVHLSINGPTSVVTTISGGYTLLGTVSNSSVDSGLTYYKVATGPGPTPADQFEADYIGGTYSEVSMLVLSGVDIVEDYAELHGAAESAGGTWTAPAVTTQRGNDLIVCFFSTESNASPSGPPSGMTLARGPAHQGTSPDIWAYIQTISVAGNTGTRSVSGVSNTAAYDHAVTVALRQPDNPPAAPTGLSPAGATTINRANSRRFSWTFNDPDTGSSQSKFDLQYRIGTGAWTTVTQTTTNRFWDTAGGTFPAGDYEWQVRTYDELGVVGPWSASAYFTAADAPGVPTITAPTDGDTISTNTATFAWSTPAQQAYRVRKVADDGTGNPDTATVYYDSGEVVSTTARSAALTFDVNNRVEHLQLQIENDGLWSAWASVQETVSFTPPAAPEVYVEPDSAAASIVLTPVLGAPSAGEPTVTSLDIYRRVTADGGNGIRVATGLSPSATWTDWTPASGVDYGYQLVAVGDNGTTASSAWTSAEAGIFGDTFTTTF